MSGFHLCIPRTETVISKTELECSVSQFQHSCICERFIYFQDRSAYSTAGKYVDWSWEYINRSQTHECGNWDGGCAVPRKGIHTWDFHCSEWADLMWTRWMKSWTLFMKVAIMVSQSSRFIFSSWLQLFLANQLAKISWYSCSQGDRSGLKGQ